MTTISERLREYEGDVVERSTIEALATAIDQQMTIDALVAAVERERETLEAIRYDMNADGEIMNACRDAVDRIDAALALARKGGK